jgi:putative transposase
MIDKQNPCLSITEQCALLKMSRSSYYYRGAGETEENQILMRRIDELYTENPTWGSRKLRDKLRLEKYRVNRKRIQRLMRKMGIETIYPKRNLSKSNHEHAIYPYLLRKVGILRPNHVWSTDITYIRLHHGWVYMVAIIDWYSKAILSWRLSNTLDRFFCIDALREALRHYGTPEVFNTDQGAQFTNPEWTGILKSAGVKISMNGKGRAADNIPIERFWRTLKYDEVYLKDYETMANAKENIGRYIAKYNNLRPHASLCGLTPMSVYSSRCEDPVVA